MGWLDTVGGTPRSPEEEMCPTCEIHQEKVEEGLGWECPTCGTFYERLD